MPSIPRIPTKQRAVYEALRADIMSGKLKPGEVLVIDNLAKRFAVSIIPVREALRQLQAERLIEITPHTGTRVTEVNVTALEEIFTLLAALEVSSALQALPRLTSQDLAALDSLLQRLETAVEREDSTGFEQANRDFHLLPCRIAAFPRAEQMLEGLLGEWERLHRLAFRGTQPPDPEKANKDHRAMVRAFRQKDAVKLADVIQRHNASAAVHYRRLIGKTPVG